MDWKRKMFLLLVLRLLKKWKRRRLKFNIELHDIRRNCFLKQKIVCLYFSNFRKIKFSNERLELWEAGWSCLPTLLDKHDPPRKNSTCCGEGVYPLRSSNRVRQEGQLNWALQLKSSGQQISWTMSRLESTLIRQY